MSEVTPGFEKKDAIDDNARKFTVGKIDADFLAEHSAKTYDLITDWLVTDEASEEKVVSKDFGDGKVEYLHITKVTENGSRKSKKDKICVDEYKTFLGASMLRVEKRRSEFDFVQGDRSFALKYDEFRDGTGVLEVDAKTDDERAAFDPAVFPYPLTEVTGDIRYYGYRIANIVGVSRA